MSEEIILCDHGKPIDECEPCFAELVAYVDGERERVAEEFERRQRR